jgi:serine/threonine-protein kinase
MQRVFCAVCDLDPNDREQALDRACAGDPDLRQGVVALLSRDADPRSFLESPVLGSDFSIETGAAGETVLEGGERVGPFTILRELGGGGQGLVYLAVDERIGRRVALKMIAPGIGVGRRTVERFRRESQAAGRIDDPGICAVHEIGEAGRLCFFAMRYVEGETLAHRLRTAATRGQPVPCTSPTRRASSTGTSSPPTSWSRRMAIPSCSTSASPATSGAPLP